MSENDTLFTMSDIANRLQQQYQQEQCKTSLPRIASDLPRSYEEINGQWLSSILCNNVPGAEVTAFDLGEPDEGSSNRRALAVTYNQAGRDAALPTRLFCKAWHQLNVRIANAITGTANAEIIFYEKIRPRINIEAPVCVFANLDSESFNGIIMLEDISDRIELFCSHDTPMNKHRVESQLRELSKLHGAFHTSAALDKELSGLGTWPEFFHRTRMLGMEESSNKGFLAAREVIPPGLYKHAGDIWQKTVACVDLHDQLPLTVIHSDVHLRNWYLVSGDQMGLGDWGCCTKGHWSRDLAYVIATACTVDDRRAWERDLIAYYLECLAGQGGPRVPFEEAWRHYRQQLFSALAWWTITYNPTPGMADMQPRESSLEFIRRITTAMDDLDSIAVP